MRVERWKGGRHWAVWDGDYLVCVTVYRRGAEEVVRRLSSARSGELLQAA